MPRTSFPSWNSAGVGCRGGAGPTAGKTAATFRVIFPDGTAAEKRDFSALGPTAIAYIYVHEGAWKCAAVRDAPDPRLARSYQTVAAERVR